MEIRVHDTFIRKGSEEVVTVRDVSEGPMFYDDIIWYTLVEEELLFAYRKDFIKFYEPIDPSELV